MHNYFLDKPEQIKISLTNICNYRCAMCFNPRLTQARGYIDDDLLYKILKDCHETGIANIALGATGEPLIHKNYFNFLTRAKSLGLWASTTSNCSLLTREKADRIIEAGLDRFNISIYSSTPVEHYNYTGTDTFSQVYENINYFLNKWHESKSSMKVNMWFLELPGINNYENFKKLWGPLCDRIGLQLPLKKMSNWSGRVDTILEKKKRRFWFEYIPGHLRICRKHKIRCDHIRYYLQILHTGEVVPCCVIPEVSGQMELLFGNVNTDTLMDVWNSPKYTVFKQNMYRRRIDGYSLCQACSEIDKTSCIHLPPLSVHR